MTKEHSTRLKEIAIEAFEQGSLSRKSIRDLRAIADGEGSDSTETDVAREVMRFEALKLRRSLARRV